MVHIENPLFYAVYFYMCLRCSIIRDKEEEKEKEEKEEEGREEVEEQYTTWACGPQLILAFLKDFIWGAELPHLTQSLSHFLSQPI